jgi:hypothetical protein
MRFQMASCTRIYLDVHLDLLQRVALVRTTCRSAECS